jgi:hypothetical protein
MVELESEGGIRKRHQRNRCLLNDIMPHTKWFHISNISAIGVSIGLAA